jgi:hypothetical protein
VGSRLKTEPLPRRMQGLVRNRVGYVVPWFVAGPLDEPERDFRAFAYERYVQAVKEDLCWLCGQKLGVFKTFVIGPMCVLNRITAEPPSHRECAVYAARVCPFMTTPGMVRRTANLPEGHGQPPGQHSDGNPGVSVLWTTKRYRLKPVPRWAVEQGAQAGTLISIGDPTDVQWYREGYRASPAAATYALELGLTKLRELAVDEFDSDKALAELEQQYRWALTTVPTTERLVTA